MAAYPIRCPLSGAKRTPLNGQVMIVASGENKRHGTCRSLSRSVDMRLLAISIAFIVCTPAVAEVTVTFPVSIPQECIELAQREGVPIVITNRYQAAKAKIKLAKLSGSDPLVSECRAAVDRQKSAMR